MMGEKRGYLCNNVFCYFPFSVFLFFCCCCYSVENNRIKLELFTEPYPYLNAIEFSNHLKLWFYILFLENARKCDTRFVVSNMIKSKNNTDLRPTYGEQNAQQFETKKKKLSANCNTCYSDTIVNFN